jgi:probable HAF family extracellular repeat protein
MIDLGTLGGSVTHATAINARGQVVGWGDTADGTNQHAFLSDDTPGGMVDVHDLLDPAFADWSILTGQGINDRGWIAATRIDPNIGQVHALLLQPVPEPGTVLLMGAGLAGLAGLAVRRRKKGPNQEA